MKYVVYSPLTPLPHRAYHVKMEINFRSDFDDIKGAMSSIQRQAIPIAAARALNRVRDTLKTQFGQDISPLVGMPQGTVKGALRATNATTTNLEVVITATTKTPNMIRQMTGAQRQFASNFWRGRGRGGKRGNTGGNSIIRTARIANAIRRGVVSVYSKTWQPSISGNRGYQKVFSAPTGGGAGSAFKEAIFKRTGTKIVPTKGKYAGRVIKRGPRKGQPLKREKLRTVFGESVQFSFQRPAVLDHASAKARERWDIEIVAQINYQLSLMGLTSTLARV